MPFEEINGSEVEFGQVFVLVIFDNKTIINNFIFKSPSQEFFNVKTFGKPVVIPNPPSTRYIFKRTINTGFPEPVSATNKGSCTIGSIFVNTNYLTEVTSVTRSDK